MPADPFLLIQTMRSLLTLVSITVLISGLYWGREVLLPLALAVLLAFLLTPATRRLERWGFSRVASVLSVASVGVVATACLCWLMAGQLVDLSASMPKYKGNLLSKVRAARSATEGTLAQAAETIQELGRELESETAVDQEAPQSLSQRLLDFLDADRKAPVASADAMNVRVVELPPSPMEQIRTWLGPLVAPLTSTGMVLVLVVFFLLNREDLRNRMLQLAGTNNLHLSTIAIDEAGQRVSHYLRMQLLINSIYGVLIGIGLFLIGIPNAFLWGVIGIAFRFVPYVGPWIMFAIPFTLALSISTGWTAPVLTATLFLLLELILNNAIEPWLYGRSTGVSSVGVIVSVIFWAWIWGPAGLVLATPITVCLVVMGRHFPQLQFVTTLFGEEVSMTLAERVYQRLLAGDIDEFEDIAETFGTDHTRTELVDSLILPALFVIETNRHADRLDDTHARLMFDQLLHAVHITEVQETPAREAPNEDLPWRVLILPDRDSADQVAGELLGKLLEEAGVTCIAASNYVLSGELTKLIEEHQVNLVIVSAVPPGSAQFAQHVARRLQGRAATLPILVGIWEPTSAAAIQSRLLAAGATAVFAQMEDVVADVVRRRPLNAPLPESVPPPTLSPTA